MRLTGRQHLVCLKWASGLLLAILVGAAALSATAPELALVVVLGSFGIYLVALGVTGNACEVCGGPQE